MTPELFVEIAIVPALRLLPLSMSSPAAMAMLVAIALQESRIKHRHQIGGPARSYWQFERGGGVRGVLDHPQSMRLAAQVCAQLDYPATADAVYVGMEHNDVLACVFARLLLFTLPQAMPDADDPDGGWSRYIAAWRPGKPHRATWNSFYEQAWSVVAAATAET